MREGDKNKHYTHKRWTSTPNEMDTGKNHENAYRPSVYRFGTVCRTEQGAGVVFRKDGNTCQVNQDEQQ